MCLTELQSQDKFNLRAVALQSPDQVHGFNNRQLFPGFAYNSFPYFHFILSELWLLIWAKVQDDKIDSISSKRQ